MEETDHIETIHIVYHEITIGPPVFIAAAIIFIAALALLIYCVWRLRRG
jgi:hypothetical protein